MPECQLVHQSERRTTKDRNLAAGLQRTTSAQFVKLLAAGRVCTDSSGDEGMSKASTELLEQGTQTPSPAPDLIPAQTENQPRTHIGIGTANGGTSSRHSKSWLNNNNAVEIKSHTKQHAGRSLPPDL